MLNSVYPNDIVFDSSPQSERDLNEVKCFFICPFEPKEKYNALLSLMDEISNQFNKLRIRVKILRADKISSSRVIHTEILEHLRDDDFIIADLSDPNPNVYYELGIAATIREKHHILIIKEENSGKFQFDVQPFRHILYKRQDLGFEILKNDLERAITEILGSLTLEKCSIAGRVRNSLPIVLDFSENDGTEKSDRYLLSPSMTHRIIRNKHLEFGSLLIYRYSLLEANIDEISNFKLTAEMKFIKHRGMEGNWAWIGIAFRTNHFLGNSGYRLLLRNNGDVAFVYQGDSYHDDVIGNINGFDPDAFYTFSIKSNSEGFEIEVNNIGLQKSWSDLEYVFPRGKILIQTYLAIVGIKSLAIEHL
jgi:hypothetical protein